MPGPRWWKDPGSALRRRVLSPTAPPEPDLGSGRSTSASASMPRSESS
jgi:hypothetical protein